jgi:serine/threonine protein kinase
MAVICNHPNISSLKESIENKTTTFIVMEYCQGHSLFSEIKTSHIQRIPEYRAKSLFRQIINAVVHLKHNKIAHRDIKAENILIHGSTVKLIDFGFSVFCDKHEMI